MKRFSKRTRLIIFLAPICLWILTLGIFIEMNVHSESQQPSGYTFEDFNNGTASISIYGNVSGNSRVIHGIPYLFHISRDVLPNGLYLTFHSAKAAKGDIISITDLRITPSQEESYILVQPEKPIEASFEFSGNRGKEGGHKPYYLVYVNFLDTIKHHSSFEAYIKGDIHHKEGSEHFDLILKIKCIRKTYIYPGWFALALSSA